MCEGGGAVNDPDAAATLCLGLHRRADLLTILDHLEFFDLLNTLTVLTILDLVTILGNIKIDRKRWKSIETYGTI